MFKPITNKLTKYTGAQIGAGSNANDRQIPIMADFNHQWTNSMSVSEAITFSTNGAGDNYIVFTAIPSDIFSYEVISVPQDCPSDGGKVGDIVTIMIPRKPGTYMTSITRYNNCNGELPDVEVFKGQEIGVPSSYPTEEKAREKIAAFDEPKIRVLEFDSDKEQDWSSYDVDEVPDEAVNSKSSSDLAYFSKEYNLATYDSTTIVATNPTTEIECNFTEENGRAIQAGGNVSVSQEVFWVIIYFVSM